VIIRGGKTIFDVATSLKICRKLIEGSSSSRHLNASSIPASVVVYPGLARSSEPVTQPRDISSETQTHSSHKPSLDFLRSKIAFVAHRSFHSAHYHLENDSI